MSNDNSKDAKMKQKTMAPSLGDRMPPYPSPMSFVVDASFIYWQADVEDLDAGVQGNFDVNTDPSALTSGCSSDFGFHNSIKDINMDFKWEPGFKFGLGLVWGERDQYDLMLNWTWIRPKATANSRTYDQLPAVNLATSLTPANIASTLQALVGGILEGAAIPGYASLFSGGPARHASSKWRLHYNTVDLEFGRNFFLGKNLTLRPHIGLRGAWLNQRLDNTYLPKLGTVALGTPVSLGAFNVNSLAITNATMNGEDEYHAVGLRAGADVYWNFTNHFAAYGKVSGSILYGYEEIEQNFTINTSVNVSGIPGSTSVNVNFPVDNNYRATSHTTKTTLQGILGLMWHTGFEDSGCHFYVSAGYEVNEWFHLNNFRTINENAFVFETKTIRKGNLGLHGLTVDVRLDF
ncbi:MAG: hypothetical protein HKM07_06550 [Chlamydiae bacterium]|nr:hypothetical protein [Chlamydiota bacterium]